MDPDTGALYVGLKMITSNPTPDRPILYLNGTQNRWIPSHVFYFGMSVRVNSGTPIISGAHNGAGVSPLNLTLKDGFNSWTVVCVGFDNFAAINFDGTTLWNFNFDSLIAYDLTVIFGEGNEPTKEEMDLLISILDINYFEGEITIPAQNVMQWQLALIRQNTAAILAIGGSII